MRILVALSVAAAVAASSFSLIAQNPDPKADLRQKLLAQFTLTQLTDDRSDIAVQGTPVLMHKAGAGIVPYSATPPPTNTYKNGKLSMGFFETYRAVHNAHEASDYKLKALALREGAKVWVTAIMVETEGVIFRLDTGKLSGINYYSDVLFPFPDGVMPPVADVLKTIAEVVTPVASENPEIYNLLRKTYVLTIPTPDNQDIAKAGSVLVLHKDGLILYPLSVGIWPVDVYKDGKITLGPGSGMPKTAKQDPDGSAPGVTRHTFNTGDKLWMVGISAHDNGVIFEFGTDEIEGHRYICALLFPFAKDQKPQPEELLKTVSEVFTIDSGDGTSGGSNASSTPPPPIAPPPLPADAPPAQPKTITIGMTRDMVVAIFGPPQKVVNLGAKEIDVYPDVKVTFTNGKVTDVQ